MMTLMERRPTPSMRSTQRIMGSVGLTDEMSPRGETLRELADDLEQMRRALYEPVLREVLNVQGEPYLLETDDEPLPHGGKAL